MSFETEDNYKLGIHDFQQYMPEVVDRYHSFTSICFSDGELDKKAKELIALGISLSHRDENCVRYHVTEALHKGATEKEIWETVNVALAMGGGMIVSQSVHWVRDSLASVPMPS